MHSLFLLEVEVEVEVEVEKRKIHKFWIVFLNLNPIVAKKFTQPY